MLYFNSMNLKLNPMSINYKGHDPDPISDQIISDSDPTKKIVQIFIKHYKNVFVKKPDGYMR